MSIQYNWTNWSPVVSVHGSILGCVSWRAQHGAMARSGHPLCQFTIQSWAVCLGVTLSSGASFRGTQKAEKILKSGHIASCYSANSTTTRSLNTHSTPCAVMYWSHS
eukprot:5935834-Amphidinium_carterae.2